MNPDGVTGGNIMEARYKKATIENKSSSGRKYVIRRNRHERSEKVLLQIL